MKNPIKYVKHLVKDPIKTVEEADARKKEIMPWLFGSIGVAVLFCALDGILGLGFLMIFGLIGVFGAMLFGFLLFVIKKAKEKFKALTCDDCKTMATFETEEAYHNAVSYIVAKEGVHSSVHVPKPDDKGVISEISASGYGAAVVMISLKCPNCGKVKTLKYEITPFKCEEKVKKILPKDAEMVKTKLEGDVKNVLEMYNSDKRSEIPYTIQSIHHPNYENRTKPQTGDSYPTVGQVKISYHRDIAEMVDGFFMLNELNGKISVAGEEKSK